LKKYLGLTDEEIVENEAMWAEENPEEEGAGMAAGGEAEARGDLTSLGLERPSEEDFGQAEQLGQEEQPPGAEGAPGGQQSPLGGPPPAPGGAPAPGGM
jgi:hypothetical protein